MSYLTELISGEMTESSGKDAALDEILSAAREPARNLDLERAGSGALSGKQRLNEGLAEEGITASRRDGRTGESVDSAYPSAGDESGEQSGVYGDIARGLGASAASEEILLEAGRRGIVNARAGSADAPDLSGMAGRNERAGAGEGTNANAAEVANKVVSETGIMTRSGAGVLKSASDIRAAGVLREIDARLAMTLRTVPVTVYGKSESHIPADATHENAIPFIFSNKTEDYGGAAQYERISEFFERDARRYDRGYGGLL